MTTHLLKTAEERYSQELEGYREYNATRAEILADLREHWRIADGSITLLGGGTLATTATLYATLGATQWGVRFLLIGWSLIIIALVTSFIAKWVLVYLHQRAIDAVDESTAAGWGSFGTNFRDRMSKIVRVKAYRRVVTCLYVTSTISLILGLVSALLFARAAGALHMTKDIGDVDAHHPQAAIHPPGPVTTTTTP